jgi:hypothetical protein
VCGHGGVETWREEPGEIAETKAEKDNVRRQRLADTPLSFLSSSSTPLKIFDKEVQLVGRFK